MKKLLVLLILFIVAITMGLTWNKTDLISLDELKEKIGTESQIMSTKENDNYSITIYKTVSGEVRKCIAKKEDDNKFAILLDGENKNLFYGNIFKNNGDKTLILLGKKEIGLKEDGTVEEVHSIEASCNEFRGNGIEGIFSKQYTISDEEYYIIIEELNSNYTYPLKLGTLTKFINDQNEDISEKVYK